MTVPSSKILGRQAFLRQRPQQSSSTEGAAASNLAILAPTSAAIVGCMRQNYHLKRALRSTHAGVLSRL